MRYDIKKWRQEHRERLDVYLGRKSVPGLVEAEAIRDQARAAYEAILLNRPHHRAGLEYKNWLETVFHPLNRASCEAAQAVTRLRAEWLDPARLTRLYQIRSQMRGRVHISRRWERCEHVKYGCVNRVPIKEQIQDHSAEACPGHGRRLIEHTLEDQLAEIGEALRAYELPPALGLATVMTQSEPKLAPNAVAG